MAEKPLTKTTNPGDLIFTPAEIGVAGQKNLADRREKKGQGIPLYIDGFDYDATRGRGFLPALPGELISILGRPGNGKTGFMMRWARKRARELQKAAALGDKDAARSVVVYITLEQSIEELHAFTVAAETGISITQMAFGVLTDEEWEKIEHATALRMNVPLWFMGHSIARRARRPKLDLDMIALSLDLIEHWDGDDCDREIDMVFVDYLQRLPTPDKAESKTIALSDSFDRLKDAALALSTVVVVGVQAKRDVDQRSVPIPAMEDGQWTSNIEQTSDGVLSVVRPRHYRNDGEMFDDVVVKGDNQMVLACLKRKLGPDNFKQWLYFDPRYNTLDKAELRNALPERD